MFSKPHRLNKVQTGGCFEEVECFGLTVKRRCELLGIGRWDAYNRQTGPNQEALENIEALRRKIDYWHTKLPYCGTRKLKTLLWDYERIKAGRKLIGRLMCEMGIRTIYPKPNLSKPRKDHKKFPYLLKNMSINFPNQVWAVDLTYIPMKTGHMYLTAVIDWYSRYIVGWCLSDTLDTAPILQLLDEAMEKHGIPAIINSDQGSQFTSEAYIKLLESKKIRQSMDGKARWVDNVIIERWFRSLKTEYIYVNEYRNPRELRNGIEGYVDEYNSLRPHQSLENEPPVRAYRSAFLAVAA